MKETCEAETITLNCGCCYSVILDCELAKNHKNEYHKTKTDGYIVMWKEDPDA